MRGWLSRELLVRLPHCDSRLLESKLDYASRVCNKVRPILHGYPNVVGVGVSLKVAECEVTTTPYIVVL